MSEERSARVDSASSPQKRGPDWKPPGTKVPVSKPDRMAEALDALEKLGVKPSPVNVTAHQTLLSAIVMSQALDRHCKAMVEAAAIGRPRSGS